MRPAISMLDGSFTCMTAPFLVWSGIGWLSDIGGYEGRRSGVVYQSACVCGMSAEAPQNCDLAAQVPVKSPLKSLKLFGMEVSMP